MDSMLYKLNSAWSSTGYSQPPTRNHRKQICIDTVARSPDVIAEHVSEGATADSVFIHEQLPHLDPSACPKVTPKGATIQVINSDAYTVALKLLDEDPDVAGKVAVLNLASDELQGGGWEWSLSTTQEEALCYSSTLFVTLKESYYPWPNVGPGSAAGVYSPGVVIFRDNLDGHCANLPKGKRRVVSVLTVAAPRVPQLSSDRLAFASKTVLEDLREKIRLVYRMAAHNNQQVLVLGAMGCGAYGCPPTLVANEMKAILLTDEFRGWFKHVIFAVYSRKDNGASNFSVFHKLFQGVELPVSS
ncbi:hypothetical protein BDN72DRAFT_841434 [Pluteus cervinus]|uniref:Uncharacterized protein n=1 Tax=Pluteus cervinus TaxID=181527 RepID=A0ACD3ATT9_9AGAR|nr:hypothetical protein BDN72DRAFT_841434 [Pluteus cervinus]